MNEHLQTLRERERYLRARVQAKASVGWEFQWDERERAALAWAIKQLTEAERDGA